MHIVTCLLVNYLQIDHIFLSRVCSETAGGLPGNYSISFVWVSGVTDARGSTLNTVGDGVMAGELIKVVAGSLR